MDVMIFNGVPPAPWSGVFTPAGVVEHHALGYQYDDEFVIPKVEIPLAYVRILFGIVNDAPGWVIGPDGKPHPVPGPEPWARLTVAERNDIAARAVQQAAALIADKKVGGQIQTLATRLSIRDAKQVTTTKARRKKR